MNAQPGWQIARLEPARLTARFDYGARPDLLRAFPFPHVLEVDASLTGAGLRVETSVGAETVGERVPVSFGWHPSPGTPDPCRLVDPVACLPTPGLDRRGSDRSRGVERRPRLVERRATR